MAKHHNQIAEPSHSEPNYRFRGHVSPQDVERPNVRAEVTAAKEGDTAVIRLYDVIDSWGGMWGISANEIIGALDELGDVSNIQLRINSPGGDAFEGIAIYNALVNHPATVDVYVDALAASAASVVAMAGDTITMGVGSQLMIHDASTIEWGNADDLRKTADMLDHMSDNIASVYAEYTGGDASVWRDAMKNETWYSPAEAVTAGLATAVAKKADKKADDTKAKNRFDLSIFNYAGRDDAPAPQLSDTKKAKPRATVSGSSKKSQENNRMTPEQLEAIGLPEDASDADITARLTELVSNQSDPETTPEEVDPPADDPTDPPTETLAPAPAEVTNEFQLPDGVVVVDKSQWEAVQNRVATVEAETERRAVADAAAERKSILDSAIAAGKFAPAQRKHYENLLTEATGSAKLLIDSLAANTVPVKEIGGAEALEGAEDTSAYPDTFLTASEKKRISAIKQGA